MYLQNKRAGRGSTVEGAIAFPLGAAAESGTGFSRLRSRPRAPLSRTLGASPGWATTQDIYTQTTPLRAEGVPSAAWSHRLTRDRRPRRSKQGLLCRLAIARAASLLPGARPGARWTIAHQQSLDDISSSESRRRVDQAHAASRALSSTPWESASRWAAGTSASCTLQKNLRR